jgi:hypothetical protein
VIGVDGVSTSADVYAARAAQANVRQYLGPALRVDLGSVALASLCLTGGRLRREHACPGERGYVGASLTALKPYIAAAKMAAVARVNSISDATLERLHAEEQLLNVGEMVRDGSRDREPRTKS